MAGLFDRLDQSIVNSQINTNPAFNRMMDSLVGKGRGSGSNNPPPPPPRGPGRPPGGGKSNGGDEEEEDNSAVSTTARMIDYIANQVNVKFNAKKYTQAQLKGSLQGLTVSQLGRIMALTSSFDAGEEGGGVDEVLRMATQLRQGIGGTGIEGAQSDYGRLQNSKRYLKSVLDVADQTGKIGEGAKQDFTKLINGVKDVAGTEALIGSIVSTLSSFVESGADEADAAHSVFGSGFDKTLESLHNLPKATNMIRKPLSEDQISSMISIAGSTQVPRTIRTQYARGAYSEYLTQSSLMDTKKNKALTNIKSLKNPFSISKYTDMVLGGADPDAALNDEEINGFEKTYSKSGMSFMEGVTRYGSYATTQGFRRGTLNFAYHMLTASDVEPALFAGGMAAAAIGGGIVANEAISKAQYQSRLSGANIAPLGVDIAELLTGTSGFNQAALIGNRFTGRGVNNLGPISLAMLGAAATGGNSQDVAQLLFGLSAMGATASSLSTIGLMAGGGVGNANAPMIQQILGSSSAANILMSPSSLAMMANAVAGSPALMSLQNIPQSILNNPALMMQFQGLTGITDKQMDQISSTGNSALILQAIRSQFLPGGQFGTPPTNEIGALQLQAFGVSASPQQFQRLMQADSLNKLSDLTSANLMDSFSRLNQDVYGNLGVKGRVAQLGSDVWNSFFQPFDSLLGAPVEPGLGSTGQYRGLYGLLSTTPDVAKQMLDLTSATPDQLNQLASQAAGGSSNQSQALQILQILRDRESKVTVSIDNGTVTQATAKQNSGAVKDVPVAGQSFLSQYPTSNGRSGLNS